MSCQRISYIKTQCLRGYNLDNLKFFQLNLSVHNSAVETYSVIPLSSCMSLKLGQNYK